MDVAPLPDEDVGMEPTRRRFLGQVGTGLALAAVGPAAWGRERGVACRVVRPGDPDYDEARLDFNARFSRFPRAILYACCTEDVQYAVKWAREHRVALRARSGGHSYEAYSLVDHGLVVDVSNIAHVRVDSRRRRAVLGAGTRLLDAYEQLWNPHKVTIPGGSCGTVGVVGLTLGGGFGLLSRQFGLTCDDLVEAEMVTADGDVLRASERAHGDLFWALRGGGGGNFGIVTELTFRVHDVDAVALATPSWPWAQIGQVIDAWQAWAPDVDPRLVSVLHVPSPDQRTVGALFQLNGPVDELRSLLAPLLAVGTPTDPRLHDLSFIDAVRSLAEPLALADLFGAPVMSAEGGVRFKNSSAYATRSLTREGIDTLVAQLEQAPGPNNFVQLDSYGGAIREVSPRDTAFFHRRARFGLQYQSYWNDDTEAQANLDWLRRFRVAMLPFTDGAYVNYIDRDIADWPRAYYGDNFDRLTRVKRAYDPDDLFHFAQSIPLR